jgi:hypothetical protein
LTFPDYSSTALSTLSVEIGVPWSEERPVGAAGAEDENLFAAIWNPGD